MMRTYHHQQPQAPELNHLLRDVANTTQGITSRLTARAYRAIANPEKWAALRVRLRSMEKVSRPPCAS